MTYRAWNTKTVDRAALKELTAAIAQQNTEELEYQNMDEEWSEEKYRSVLAAQQKEAGLLAGILAGGRRRAERPHAPDRHGQSL